MKITDDDIQNLAHLSRLELSASESISMKQDLGKILDFVANIEKLDLKNIKPLIYMTNAENVLREDHANSSIVHEQAMKNGPDADSDYFKVPKVVDK
jgi:aspartyl-tRNA(Asn)/glutamyl-tRNA(Gln) amidotransferase subunit C